MLGGRGGGEIKRGGDGSVNRRHKSWVLYYFNLGLSEENHDFQNENKIKTYLSQYNLCHLRR